MKINKTFAVILAMAVLPSLADVEALYWQVTSDMNPTPIQFQAAAMVAEDGSGNKTYLNDSNGNAWQSANSDKTTTETIASIWSDTYASGYTFYIELMNKDDGGNWYTAGSVNKSNGSNWSYADISANIFSSSSMAMNLATPLTSGTAHVPEPTSGLLMLVGGALLALRRRRV